MDRQESGITDWLGAAALWCTAIPVLAGPWLFGAWEMWWFWPLAALIFLGVLLTGIRLAFLPRPLSRLPSLREPSAARLKFALIFLAAFLVYALLRATVLCVAMTAERSVLLFLLPALVAAQTMLAGPARTAILFRLILANLLILGIYGCANHFFFDNARVMWAPAYEQYRAAGRASGSYYCPDHFAGAMELGTALALGVLLNRDRRWALKAAGLALLAVSVLGVVISKSRGGGLTLLVIGFGALVWGFSQWKAYHKWCYRTSAAALAGICLFLFMGHARGFMDRAVDYPLFRALEERPVTEWHAAVAEAFPHTDRGLMIRGALRAWATSRTWGIGPGMHQVLWPRFAATTDGNREMGLWPSETNETFHSYEVHSDWVQLLEEYGIVGFALFSLFAAAAFAALVSLHATTGRRRRNKRKADSNEAADSNVRYGYATLAALLATVAMAFHSLGDFNLQMPATGWMFAAIVALPVSLLAERRGASEEEDPGK